VQSMDMVTPVLGKVYIALGLSAFLACSALYLEMKKTKVVLVIKEKTESEKAVERTQAETDVANLEILDSKVITSTDTITLLSDSLQALGKKLHAVAGACYISKEINNTKIVELVSGYALPLSQKDVVRFDFGEGMIGQVAKSGSSIYLDEIPEGYVQVESGLGQASPRYIMIVPLKKSSDVKGVLELATFKVISPNQREMIEKFALEIGKRITN
jgi:GAF domain